VQVADDDEIILITDQGTLVRTRVSEVSCQGRNTQGVTLIRLTNDEHLVGVVRVVEDDEELEDEIEGDVVEGEVVEGGVTEESSETTSDAEPDTGESEQ